MVAETDAGVALVEADPVCTYRSSGYDTSVAALLRSPCLATRQDFFVEHATYIQSKDPLAAGPTRVVLDTFETVASPFDAQDDILFYCHDRSARTCRTLA
jgi:hypothetical protein